VCRRAEAGVALLAATVALALVTVLATGLAYTTVVDQQLTRHAIAAVQADALARSGVAAAAVVLREVGAAGAPDTLGASWARDVGPQPLGAGWVEVRVEDEARRLDLGAPELAPALPRLVGVLGLDPALADAIADWVDADDTPRARGAERDWYLSLDPPYVPRNAPPPTVGELALVRGASSAALARLAPYVTVAGERGVNPNTASREVLLAVLDDQVTVERLLAARARGPLDADRLAALLPDRAAARRLLVPRGQHYTVRVVAGVGRIRRAAKAVVWAPAGLDPEIVSWRPLPSAETAAALEPPA
jgi:general secretion pathway protein K